VGYVCSCVAAVLFISCRFAVTEFRGSGSDGDEQNFINTMIPWLGDLGSVERYAYFGDINGILIDGNNQLTDLGAAYVNAGSA
jgi:hypothetical protein